MSVLPLALLRYAFSFVAVDARTAYLVAAVCQEWRRLVWGGGLLRELQFTQSDSKLWKEHAGIPIRLPAGLYRAELRYLTRLTDAHCEVLSSVGELAMHTGIEVTDAGFSHLTALHSLCIVAQSSFNAPAHTSAAAFAHLHSLARLETHFLRSSDADLAHLTGLKSLFIVDADQAPPSLRAFPELCSLRMDLWRISNLADDSFEGLLHLTKLQLDSMCSLSDACYSHLSALRELSLNLPVGQGVTKEGLRHLSSLQSLELDSTKYSLDRCCLYRDLQGNFSFFTALRSLRVSFGDDDVDANAFKHLSKLHELVLLQPSSGVGDAAFMHLTSLTRLDMQRYKGGVSDAAFAHLGQLRELDLAQAECKAVTPRAFTHLTSLRSLDISQTHLITQESFRHFTGLTRLVMRGAFTAGPPFHLIRGQVFPRPKKRPIHIDPADFAHLANLQTLDMRCFVASNKLGARFRRLAAVPSLRRFTRSELSEGFRHLTALRSLDVSWSEGISDAACQHLKGLTRLCCRSTDWSWEAVSGLMDLHVLHLPSTSTSTRDVVKSLPFLHQLHDG